MKKLRTSPIGKICAVLLLVALLFSLAACSMGSKAGTPAIAGVYRMQSDHGDMTLTFAKDGTYLETYTSDRGTAQYDGIYRYSDGELTISAFHSERRERSDLCGTHICVLADNGDLIIAVGRYGEFVENGVFTPCGKAPNTIQKNDIATFWGGN